MKIQDFLKNNLLILDGAMGTMLYEKGLKVGEPTELWNITHPDIVTEIHRAYIRAGSMVVTANTFGANPLKYDGENGGYSVRDVVKAGLDCARKATEAEKSHAYVALDIGPLGKLIGRSDGIGFEEATATFAEIVRAGKEYADLIIIETMTDICEMRAAILAAKENSELPVISTVVFDADGHMMSGADPKTATTLMQGLGVDALGMNCSLGPVQMLPLIPEIMEYSSVPVVIQPNAGMPRIENGRAVYDISAEEFADFMLQAVRLGVHGIGGCCGTTPEYIKCMCRAVKDIKPVTVKPCGKTLVCSQTRTEVIGDRPKLVGERINPTGKSKIKEALRSGDHSFILSEALAQQDMGAHMLDVNAGLPGIDEAQVLTTLVKELSELTFLPLQIDTSDPVAMEKALRAYCGKALINSVNGKKESLESVLPLVSKYGGVLIGLTLDENGIPETVQGRVDIALRIIKEAEKYGIEQKNIVIDPLTLSVSADRTAARTTLETVAALHRMGIHTMLGVSNVSFGLPERDTVNAAFFTMAMQSGLSLAIMNPCSLEMQKAYHTFVALCGKDEGFREYIEFASVIPDTAQNAKLTGIKSGTSAQKNDADDKNSALYNAILRGLTGEAENNTALLLEKHSGLDVINNHILPALNKVGELFESKKIFLPQLLTSSDAASAAFGKVKENMQKGVGGMQKSKGKIILATVKGDIHDIGKNIVKMILENYGYDIIDLGRDVSYETILNSTEENKVRLVGLSALMTTTVPAMEKTVKLIHEKCPWCKVMVGGAVLSAEYAEKMGADFYGSDAMAAVRIAEKVFC